MAEPHLGSDDDYDVDVDRKADAVKSEPASSPPPSSSHDADDSTHADGDGDTSLNKSATTSPKKKPESHDDRNEEGESHAKSKKEKQEEERRKMQVLVSHFSEDQLNRYEMYRRAAFPKAAIKRLMQSTAGTAVPQNVVIAMSGIAKVFVGEIVEEALDIMESAKECGPLQPKHIREAVRRLKSNGAIQTRGRKRMRLS